jgi:hypothetical protein
METVLASLGSNDRSVEQSLALAHVKEECDREAVLLRKSRSRVADCSNERNIHSSASERHQLQYSSPVMSDSRVNIGYFGLLDKIQQCAYGKRPTLSMKKDK